MTSPLRVGILSAQNSFDRNSFSGTLFYMRRALEACARIELTVLGGHRPVRTGVGGALGRLRKPRPFEIRAGDDAGLDVILAPVAAREVADFGDRLAAPVVMITDATPSFLKEFYGMPVTDEVCETEARVLDRVSGVVYSSHFMAQRALSEFPDLSPEHVHVVPFGVNLDTLPEKLPEKPPLETLNLLFIGQDWERKGGSIALEALDALLAAGRQARLTVIGASSPDAEAHPSVDVLGYLDKNKAKDNARFEAALQKAHVLLFPTRADCTPMVIAEANAHGCPVVVTETGGIGTLVSEGVNGHLIPFDAEGADYARAVQELTVTQERYAKVSAASFAWCREHLTWEAWVQAMVKVMEQIRSETAATSGSGTGK